MIPKEGSAVGLEHGARQRFGEDVRRVALGLDVLRGDDAALDEFADEEVAASDVLRSSVEDDPVRPKPYGPVTRPTLR